jgi:hypothetical protein
MDFFFGDPNVKKEEKEEMEKKKEETKKEKEETEKVNEENLEGEEIIENYNQYKRKNSISTNNINDSLDGERIFNKTIENRSSPYIKKPTVSFEN